MCSYKTNKGNSEDLTMTMAANKNTMGENSEDRFMKEFNESMERVRNYYGIGRVRTNEYIIQYGEHNVLASKIADKSYRFDIISMCHSAGGSHYIAEPVITSRGYVVYYCIFSNVIGYTMFMLRNYMKYPKENSLEFYN